MSNVNVGNVYNQIIRDVVESSRVDFEEGGVDESVLDELMKVSLFFFCQRPFHIQASSSSYAIRTLHMVSRFIASFERRGGDQFAAAALPRLSVDSEMGGPLGPYTLLC